MFWLDSEEDCKRQRESDVACSLPESEQASRYARQEPDVIKVEASDDGLSGSGTDNRSNVRKQQP